MRDDVPHAARAGPAPRFRLRGMLVTYLPTLVLPVVLYQVLIGRGVATIPALTATAIFPLGSVLFDWARTRRLNVLGVLVLLFIVVGVVTSVLSGDPRFYLIKESFLTGTWALLCFGSLLLPRPPRFYFARDFVSAGNPEAAARFDGLWAYPTFRCSQRLVTIVWGVAFLAEALLRLALSFILPVPVFLVVSPAVGTAVTIGLIAWSVAYGRRTAERGQAAAQAAAALQAARPDAPGA
jgi:hypothetical protein